MVMAIRCERVDSTVFSVELVNKRADGPAAKRFLPTGGSGNPPSDGAVPELTTIGPIGEAMVPQLAVREGAVFVRSITVVDDSIIARFSALITVPGPVIGNCGPLSSL